MTEKLIEWRPMPQEEKMRWYELIRDVEVVESLTGHDLSIYWEYIETDRLSLARLRMDQRYRTLLDNKDKLIAQLFKDYHTYRLRHLSSLTSIQIGKLLEAGNYAQAREMLDKVIMGTVETIYHESDANPNN